jgi:hypothetical protein
MPEIECLEGVEYLYFAGVDTNEFRVPRRADWDQLRACIDEAERRSRRPGAHGYCPHCGSAAESRERRPGGNDRCGNGHVYPSSAAVGVSAD